VSKGGTELGIGDHRGAPDAIEPTSQRRVDGSNRVGGDAGSRFDEQGLDANRDVVCGRAHGTLLRTRGAFEKSDASPWLWVVVAA
jgi:hypothetical protein